MEEEFAKKKRKTKRHTQKSNARKHGRYYEQDIEELITGQPTVVFEED